MLTHGSLFSGIGGFDLGFERAGFRSVWQVEQDPYCLAVLAQHFPTAKRFKNIRRFTSCKSLESVDVITGGFPCQPFSQAGKRHGASDDRYLWPEMLRVISALRPAWVVAENVYGLTTLKSGVVFERVLSDLEGQGYEVQPFIIPACAVDAPHRRDRVWIVAHTERQSVRPGLRTDEPTGERRRRSGDGSRSIVSDTQHDPTSIHQQREKTSNSDASRPCWWLPEPNVGRVAHGIPRRVDRLKALGNAVVPQVAEQIAWAIRAAIESTLTRG